MNKKKDYYNFNILKKELKIYEKLKNVIPNNLIKIYDTYILESNYICFFIMEKINCCNINFNNTSKIDIINLIEILHNNNIYHGDLHLGNFG